MKDFEKFYIEVESVSADISALINVLNLYYKTFVYSGNAGSSEDYAKFCDWLYIINRYADEVWEEVKEMLSRNA